MGKYIFNKSKYIFVSINMGILSKLLKVNGTVFVGGTGLTFYYYPELRTNPAQVGHAMVRGGRTGYTGAMMAQDYLSAKEITSETHKLASGRLYDCMCKNSGTYIKLG